MTTQRSVRAAGWCKRGLTLLAGLALSACATTASMVPGPQYMIVGVDQKVTWDDTGKVVFLPPGKDVVSVVDISTREAPRIVASLPLMNSVFGPPTNLAITPDERVAIVAPNAGRFLVSLFGVSAFGRVLVPVNFRLNAEEIRYIIEHSGSTVALVDPEMEAIVAPIPVKHRFILGAATDTALFGRAGARPRFSVHDENATVSVNYTSGTTARPKGVQLTHRGCWLNAVTFGWHVGVSDRDVYLHTLPTFHCNGWGMPYAVTAMGARHVVIRKIDGEDILRRIDAEGVTLLNGAPAVVAAILGAAQARRERGEAVPGAGRVRMVVAGAPPPDRPLAASPDPARQRQEDTAERNRHDHDPVATLVPVLATGTRRGRVDLVVAGRPRDVAGTGRSSALLLADDRGGRRGGGRSRRRPDRTRGPRSG